MKKLPGIIALLLCMLLSGCTIAEFTFMRNLTPHTVEVYFDFNIAAMKSIPDSIYIPYSATSHTVNRKAIDYMTDSIVAKRYTGTTLHISVPTGGMIMFDKNTAYKIGYNAPEKIRVAVPGKEPYTVRVFGAVQSGERQFQEKGNSPKLRWHDVY
jgi:hypothetical protein